MLAAVDEVVRWTEIIRLVGLQQPNQKGTVPNPA